MKHLLLISFQRSGVRLLMRSSLSRVGSLHGLKKGSGKSPRPSVMIAAHMDAIGMRVSKIVDGFLHITNIGGIDVRVLPGAEVTVHASGSDEELPAVVVMPPARFLPELVGDGVPGIEHLLVDTGLLPREVGERFASETWFHLRMSRLNWLEM